MDIVDSLVARLLGVCVFSTVSVRRTGCTGVVLRHGAVSRDTDSAPASLVFPLKRTRYILEACSVNTYYNRGTDFSRADWSD